MYFSSMTHEINWRLKTLKNLRETAKYNPEDFLWNSDYYQRLDEDLQYAPQNFEDFAVAGMADYIEFIYDDSENICGLCIGDTDFYVGDVCNGLEILEISKKNITFRCRIDKYGYRAKTGRTTIGAWLKAMSI